MRQQFNFLQHNKTINQNKQAPQSKQNNQTKQIKQANKQRKPCKLDKTNLTCAAVSASAFSPVLVVVSPLRYVYASHSPLRPHFTRSVAFEPVIRTTGEND